MTTKVIFTFHNPDGSPQANEKFTVRLTRPGMSDAEHCVVIPETYEMVTDAKGEFTMDLESSTSAYRVTAVGDDDEYEDDPCSQYTFTFYVPDSSDPVYVQELILMPPPTNLPWDEEAMNKITQAVVDARNARDDAEESADRAEAQVGLAAEQVELAKDQVDLAKAEVAKAADQVDLAKAEVTKAAEQVGLAKAEVTKATAQADRSKEEADRATTQATAAATSVTQAKSQADRSKTEADRSKSEADRARDLADGMAEMVEGGSLPPLVGMNETFTYEGTDPYRWTVSGPATAVSDGNVMRLTKTDGSGSRAFLRQAVTFPDSHWIVYMRLKTQSGTAAQNRSAQIRFITADNKDCAVYFNVNANGLVEPNTIHMQGTEGGSRNAVTMFTGLGTEDWLDLAVKYDAVNRHIELFRRMPNGIWQKGGGRLMVDAIKPAFIEVSSMPVAPQNWWLDLDYISVCKPNLICYGDSIAAGQNEYGVTRGNNPYNNNRNWAGTWFGKVPLYATNRNNLVLVQGVEGRRTWQYLSQLSEISGSGVKVVFMHASTNDVNDETMTQAKRTSDTQAIVDQLHAVGAQVVLFNSMQGTKAYNDASTNTVKLRDYTDQWWSTELPKVNGLAQTLDIARLIAKDGYMDPALADADGLHLTDAAAQKIAAKLGQFFSNSSDTNGFASLDSPAFTGIPTVPTQTPFLPFGKQIANTEYVVTFIQDWTSNYGYGDLSMRNRTGSQMEAGGVRSGYYYVPGDSSNPLPGNVYAFVHHMSYDTNKGWELWNHCYTDRVYMRYSNNAGVWQTPVEVVTEKWMERNSFMTPRVSAFNRLPVASSAGFEGVVPLQTNSSGAWRNVNAGVAGLDLLGATTAGNALHYIGGMPKAPTNDRANSNLNNLPDECGFYGLGPAPYSNIPPGVDAINPVGSTVYHQVYDANTATQIFIPRTSDICYFRRKAGGTWSPWVRYLTDLQLVGTTTDSSAGVPNGAIMQINGSAAVNVGVALRFADGTQIVRALLQLDYGAVDILQRQFTFPMAFVGKPVVTATLEQGTVADINNMPLQALGPVMVASIYSGNCNVRVMRSQGYTAGGFAAGSKMLCSVIAMGFWK